MHMVANIVHSLTAYEIRPTVTHSRLGNGATTAHLQSLIKFQHMTRT